MNKCENCPEEYGSFSCKMKDRGRCYMPDNYSTLTEKKAKNFPQGISYGKKIDYISAKNENEMIDTCLKEAEKAIDYQEIIRRKDKCIEQLKELLKLRLKEKSCKKCGAFLNEDMYGYGFCNVLKKEFCCENKCEAVR